MVDFDQENGEVWALLYPTYGEGELKEAFCRCTAVIGRIYLGLFYPGGGVVDSLPCTILGSATKRLKESDLVVTQPSNNFGR
ncbi:GDP dissociation inhibitor [Medicago truncatula]|uniref:GDP dissociation inhibitor n=1 Tax=Medicago truncatula TaxID=3880 RepID=G7KB12_MEDTR|nr:GDP dissociation inhibitor [Medicago truncatula]